MAQGLRIISSAITYRIYFAASSMLITVALSRYLGLDDFGLYAWLTSIAFLLSGLAQAGGNSLVVRETSRSAGRQLALRILQRTGLISAATLLVLTLGVLLYAEEHVTLRVLAALVLLALSNLTLVLISASIRGVGWIQAGQIPELVLRPTLFLLLIGGVMLSGQTFGAEAMVYYLVLAFVVSVMVAALLLVRGLAQRPEAPDETPEADWLGGFFRLGLMGWLAVGNAQLLIILTGALANYAEAGLYRVATQAVLIIGLGFSALETVQAPAYARAYKDDDHFRLHHLLQQSCRIGVAIAAAVMLVLFLLGWPLLALLFGESYTAAYPALTVLAGAQLVNAMTGNVGILLIAAKQEQKLILGNLAALVITLLAAWLFIPQYGALAAAVAGGLGLTLRNLLAMGFCWQTLGILALPFAPYSRRTTDREH